MASGRKKNTNTVIEEEFNNRNFKKEKPVVQETMKTRTFQMKDSEYELLRDHCEKELGLKIGAGIRFVLHQYINKNIR